tara:strand:+ start:7395 stop:7526 length:132 start_codon:yes stop_codon:yes gene_type:complete
MKTHVLDRIDNLVVDMEEEGIPLVEIMEQLREYVEVVEEMYGK